MRGIFAACILSAGFALAGPGLSLAQSSDDQASKRLEPLECWTNYSECASAAFGDEGWRSGCYADFTVCLGNQDVGQCTSKDLPAPCSEYRNLCLELTDGNSDAKAQCEADVDVCGLANGC